MFLSAAAGSWSPVTPTASQDVFVKDRQTNAIVRVSGGTGRRGCGRHPQPIPRSARMGSTSRSTSTASTLAAGDTNGAADVFVYDVDASDDRAGEPPDWMAVAANGRSDWSSHQRRTGASSRSSRGATNDAGTAAWRDRSSCTIAMRMPTACSTSRAPSARSGVSSPAGMLACYQSCDVAVDQRRRAVCGLRDVEVAGPRARRLSGNTADVFIYDRVTRDTIAHPAAAALRRCPDGSCRA